MFCSKCGQQLPDEASFCFKCGNTTVKEIEKKQSIDDVFRSGFKKLSEVSQSSMINDNNSKNRLKKIRNLILILSIILILISIIAYFVFKKSFNFIDIQKDSDSIGVYDYRKKWSGPVITGFTMYFRVQYKGNSGDINVTVSGENFPIVGKRFYVKNKAKYLIKIYFDEGLWGNAVYDNKNERPSVFVKLPGLTLTRKLSYGTRSEPILDMEFIGY